MPGTVERENIMGDAQKEMEMKKLITSLVVCVLSGGVFATTWTVDDDGLDFPKADFDNIQAAVDASSDGDEIIVMPGTYTETVDLLGKEVWLHSSKGAEVTIIDGEGGRRGILCNNGETSNTIIEGFTITNGYAGYTSKGGGILCENATPKLLNLIIENNHSGYTESCGHDGTECCYGGGYGGGLYASIGSGSGTLEITNCMFSGNTVEGDSMGAGAYVWGQIHFTDCEFTNNSDSSAWCSGTGGGGGLRAGGGSVIENCTFTNNSTDGYGGGLYGGGIISNCTFTNNSSDISGGGLYGGGIISNCTFIDNNADNRGGSAYGGTSYTSCSFSGGAATEGGGLYGGGIISDCSFSDNMATDFGGSIFIYSSGVDIQNSTFCNSSPNHIEGDYTNSGGNTFFDDCGIGACCTHNQLTCVEAPETQCLQFGLEFLGEGTTCENASCATSCPGDINGDGNVDVTDLMILIAYWGTCP